MSKKLILILNPLQTLGQWTVDEMSFSGRSPMIMGSDH
jgi:hypothetical protein